MKVLPALLLLWLPGVRPSGEPQGKPPPDFPEDQKRPNWVRPYLQFGEEGTEPGKLLLPRSAAVGKEDRIFVADSANHRLQEFSIGGKLLGTRGRAGSGPAEFRWPSAVAVGEDGEVFVADTGNDRIQVLDAKGGFLREWGKPGDLKAPIALAVAAGRVYVVEEAAARIQVFTTRGEPLLSFGGHGGAPGKFREPAGIAVDEQGDLFVSDSGNCRIQKFNAKGEPLAQWGSWGAYQGFLSAPSGLACSGNRLYVADSGNHRVQVFDRSGAYLYQWGRPPTRPQEGEGRLHFPAGLAVSPSGGFTVVCEPLEGRIQVFANGSARKVTASAELPWWDNLHVRFHASSAPKAPPTGKTPWSRPPPILAAQVEPEAHAVLFFDVAGIPARVVARAGGHGHRLGEFSWPSSVVRHPATGRFYVCDRGNRRIQILELPVQAESATGFAPWARFIGAFEPGKMVPPSVAGYRPERASPEAVAFGPAGELYVTDAFNAMVLVFDPEARFSRAIRLPEGRRGRLGAVAAGADGKSIVVHEVVRGEVLVLSPSGELLSTWGGGEVRAGGFATEAGGSVMMTDGLQRVVRKLDPAGKELARWGRAGRQEGQFNTPSGISFLNPDLLLIDDFGNHCGHVFASDGRYVQMIMKGGDARPMAVPK